MRQPYRVHLRFVLPWRVWDSARCVRGMVRANGAPHRSAERRQELAEPPSNPTALRTTEPPSFLRNPASEN